RARGRRSRYPHWSKGTLCFNVEAFLSAYKKAHDIIGIDYRNVLQWAITDPNGGQSAWNKPDNYNEPLPKMFSDGNARRYLRLARLWSSVPPNANLKEKQFQEIAGTLLTEQGVANDLTERLLQPMGELMSTLRDVKLSKITFLELSPYDKNIWTEDEYNDAI